MQINNSPGKIVLPFAEGDPSGRATIPTTTTTPGYASLSQGFPPITRTPKAAGGIPPRGVDMNGILNAISAAARWSAAGGGYKYDATFANDANVAGYPKGARVLNAAGSGYWLNTVDGNTSNPDTGGAGWVRDYATGAPTTNVDMPFWDGSTWRELIVQWGVVSISTSSAVQNRVVTLPQSFPTAYVNGICVPTDVSPNGQGCRACPEPGTTTQFRFNHSAGASFSTTVNWICWGY